MTGDNTSSAGPTGAGRGRRKQPVTVEELDRRVRAAENLGDEHETKLLDHLDRLGVIEEGLVAVNDRSTALTKANKALAGLVAKVREDVARRDQADEEEDKKKPVVSWLTADEVTAAAAREDLEQWLVDVYLVLAGTRKDPVKLPDCWLRHPGAVERLLALRDGHRVAWDDGASPTVRLDWLYRHLPATKQAVDDELNGCSLAAHVTKNLADFKPRQLTGDDDAGEVTSWWVDSRGLRPEPTPTRNALATEEARLSAERQQKLGGPNGY